MIRQQVIPQVELDAIHALEGDVRAQELFRKDFAGKMIECPTEGCGWFFKMKCPKCSAVSIDVYA
jgi:hypothetical protein